MYGMACSFGRDTSPQPELESQLSRVAMAPVRRGMGHTENPVAARAV